MTTDIGALEVRILSRLWCSSANCLHLSFTSSAISVVIGVYVIAPGFGSAQLRVSLAVVKGPIHDVLRFRS